MALDSDVMNADSQLHVQFYTNDRKPYVGVPFVRIVVPGDKTNVIEQPVREDHKERFPRQWLYFQMQNSDQQIPGTPIAEWNKDSPDDCTDGQLTELQILKFQTVEQIATASDAQLQRIGMGATGLRERARLWLQRRNKSESSAEHENTKRELAELKAQVALLLAAKSGKPEKSENGRHHASTGSAGNG